jgi:hypothetical protein
VTHHTWTGTLPVWWLLAPPNNPAHLNMDLQGITWKKCQEDFYEHIVSRHALLKSYIQHTNHRQETSWFGHINGDKLYGGHDGKGVQILNHLQFLDFATWAYNTYPCDIKIQVVMIEPPEVSSMMRCNLIFIANHSCVACEIGPKCNLFGCQGAPLLRHHCQGPGELDICFLWDSCWKLIVMACFPGALLCQLKLDNQQKFRNSHRYSEPCMPTVVYHASSLTD